MELDRCAAVAGRGYTAHLVRMPGLDGEPEYASRAHNQLILGAPVDVAERWRATLVQPPRAYDGRARGGVWQR